MYVFTILFTHALIYLPKALAEAKKLFAFPWSTFNRSKNLNMF
jgi:hypothetical protein